MVTFTQISWLIEKAIRWVPVKGQCDYTQPQRYNTPDVDEPGADFGWPAVCLTGWQQPVFLRLLP